ncbi:DUF5959 family protein [Streptomyces sp. enrichment culture]|uniref:DUF5959 family protein n=1 Tax=Streptomyces sp. enrichment culture TaxID=1795815 RepID=UPI003F551F22
MTEPGPMDLVHLADPDGTRFVVRVVGRFEPGVLTGHDILRVDVLASTSFVDARLDAYLCPADLDSWERQLSRMGPGRTAAIDRDRGLSFDIHMHEDGCLSVQIIDPDRLTAVLGTEPQGDWIGEHQGRLEQVRAAWPREVVETAPGAYEWSPDRER